ncbi:MAG: glycosyltransferase family 2 protein [Gemmatimonadales bacterium]|nr:glycosyltransferase family 2 protein [Gemmatimonadales bacterium]
MAKIEKTLLLSLCMIVKNESETVKKCLNSVRNLVDEMVVVDTGSSDGTQEIVQKMGARLIQSTWENDFSRARNQAIDNAKGRWILILDADEYLLPEGISAVRILLKRNTKKQETPATAFRLIQKSALVENETSGITAHQVRIFPNNPAIRYRGPVHEQVESNLAEARISIINTDVVVMHSGYTGDQTKQEKQERNRKILLAQLENNEVIDPHTYFFLGGAHLDLGDVEDALASYRDCHELTSRHPDFNQLAEGAQVKIVDCLIHLRKFEEALSYLPDNLEEIKGEPGLPCHPLLIAYRAKIEQELGNIESARKWYELLMRAVDQPRIPAINTSSLKLESLKFLGSYWKEQGRMDIAVGFLHLAQSIIREGCNVTDTDLKKLYKMVNIED